MASDRTYIAIPSHSNAAILRETLRCLFTTEGDYKVHGWDDGSTDDTSAAFREFGIEPVRHERRQGVVQTRAEIMAIARESDCRWFCFLDEDVYVREPDWLTRLIASYRDGLTTGKLLLPDGRVWGAGGCWKPNPGMPCGIEATLRGFHEEDRPEFAVPAQVPHIATALCFCSMDLLRRGLIVDTGGGNLRTCEDTDLSMQVQFDFGESCWYEPVPFVHNSHSFRHNYEQPDAALREYLRECEEGRAKFWQKWGDRIRERWPIG